MLLLSAEHNTAGSLEKCNSKIAMTTYCQLESVMLDGSVVITSQKYSS